MLVIGTSRLLPPFSGWLFVSFNSLFINIYSSRDWVCRLCSSNALLHIHTYTHELKSCSISPPTLALIIYFLKHIFPGSSGIQRSHNTTSLTLRPVLLTGADRSMLAGSLYFLIRGVFCTLLRKRSMWNVWIFFYKASFIYMGVLNGLWVKKDICVEVKYWCLFICLNLREGDSYASHVYFFDYIFL